jgi:hypothetical protein
MATWLWIVIVIAVVLIALAAAMAARRRRTMALRQRFGAEYDRAVEAREDQRAAEADLRGRERERARLDIKPLSEASRARYTGEWRAVQQSFVDQPEEAATEADGLLHRVMSERGYPMGDFAAQADLVSVDHPDVVENYRVAHGIYERAQLREASTEELREALLRYRSLFEELLRADDDAAVAAGTGATTTGAADTGAAAGAGAASTRPGARSTAAQGSSNARGIGEDAAPARPVSGQPADSRNAMDVETRDDAG